jgi:hypothetical protein
MGFDGSKRGDLHFGFLRSMAVLKGGRSGVFYVNMGGVVVMGVERSRDQVGTLMFS